MNIVYHPDFFKSVKNLPISQQKKLAKLIELVQRDPFYPSLHTKRLSGKLANYFSFRVTRDYRVIFQFMNNETIQLFKVKHRRDIYQ